MALPPLVWDLEVVIVYMAKIAEEMNFKRTGEMNAWEQIGGKTEIQFRQV